MVTKTMKEILLKDKKDNPGREEKKIEECKEKLAIRKLFEYMDAYNYSNECIDVVVQKMKKTTNDNEVLYYINMLHEWIGEKRCRKRHKKNY